MWTRVREPSKASLAPQRPWFQLLGASSHLLTLGQRAVLSRTRVNRVVDELVAAGLAERQPDTTGSLSSSAAPTTVGREAL